MSPRRQLIHIVGMTTALPVDIYHLALAPRYHLGHATGLDQASPFRLGLYVVADFHALPLTNTLAEPAGDTVIVMVGGGSGSGGIGSGSTAITRFCTSCNMVSA